MDLREDCFINTDSDDEEGFCSSGASEADAKSYTVDDVTSLCQKKNYLVLNQEDIQNHLEEDISEIRNLLSVSKGTACPLLRHYSWRVNIVQEKWFADEAKVRQAVGLFLELEKPIGKVDANTCNICFDETVDDTMFSAACGKHLYCSNCWKLYISTSISDGVGCLILCCPEPSCNAIVDFDMIDILASKSDKVKYHEYLCRSYVEDSKKRKWCPAPGCDLVVQCDYEDNLYDVACDCSYMFCWNCNEERHRPVDCETVGMWVQKNRCDSDNAEWILAFTKPCPKCNRPIEKNQGCNHMTCRVPCRFMFCWLCLEPLKGHVNCNGYKMIKRDDTGKMPKREMRRYSHYFERWLTNKKSMERALADLSLAKKHDIIQAEMNFVKEAWEQIVECRHVLKWTYAYAYCIPENEASKTRFFEYLQGEAESALERLHHCAEMDLQNYIKAYGEYNELNEFRTKLVHLTKVTKSFFENLVRAVENGFSEVSDAPNLKNHP